MIILQINNLALGTLADCSGGDCAPAVAWCSDRLAQEAEGAGGRLVQKQFTEREGRRKGGLSVFRVMAPTSPAVWKTKFEPRFWPNLRQKRPGKIRSIGYGGNNETAIS
jgi:hypothetical protein